MSKIPNVYPHGAPLYWRDEQSGQLAIAVHRYFKGLSLHPDLIELMRDYMLYWVNCPSFELIPEIRERLVMQLEQIKTKEDIDAAIKACLQQTIDPF